MKDPRSYTNVPKSNLARKKTVWKKITVGDIVFIILCVACCFAIPFPIPFIPILARITICLILATISAALLIRNKTTGLRVYQSIWLFLKYWATTRKYSKESFTKNIAISKIENSFVKQTYKGKTMYLGALKIHGFDLLNSDFEEQLYYVDTFHSILTNNENFFSLVKIKETHNWNENIRKVYEKIDDLKMKQWYFKTPQQWKAKLNQLNALIKWYFEQEEKKNYTTNSWYVICYGSNPQELETNLKLTYNNWNRLFYVEEINQRQTISLLKNIWDPLKNNFNNKETDEFKAIPEEQLSFYSDAFKIGKDKFYSLGTLSVEKFPLKTEMFWLNRLSKVVDTTFVINLHPVSPDQARKIIQRSINNSAYAENQLDQYKKAVEKAEYRQQMEVIEGVKEHLATGREILINTNIFFLTYGNTNGKLKVNVSKLKEALKNENMFYNPLNFRQKDFFACLVPNGFDEKIATDSIVFPALPLASSFPMMDSAQIDDTGCILGINYNNNPVVVDVNIRNSKRINSNGLILGNTGSGKTTTMKKILNNHLAMDGIAFVIDPEQDYVHLTQYYDGKIIDAADGNKARINPLQILLNESELDIEIDDAKLNDEKNFELLLQVNENLISTHLTLFMQWFKLLDIPFNDYQNELLKTTLVNFYKFEKLYEKNLYKLEPENFPTFSDFVDYIYSIEIPLLNEQKLSKEKDKSAINKGRDIYLINKSNNLLMIAEALNNNFLEGGIYNALYNGYSTLKISNDPIVNFDVKKLLMNQDQKRKQAQLILIIAYIQNAININGYGKNPKKSLLIVDEAHLFIDAKYPDTLIFLSQMSKRIRKRSGGLWITTQNPSDFIATEEITRYTRSLMENTQYTIIQTLKPNDANAIVEMYKNTPNPITEAEKNFIQNDKKGQALVIIGSKNRQCVEIMVMKEELKSIGLDPMDKFHPSKLDLNIDFKNFIILNESEIEQIIEKLSSPNLTLKNVQKKKPKYVLESSKISKLPKSTTKLN